MAAFLLFFDWRRLTFNHLDHLDHLFKFCKPIRGNRNAVF